MDLRSIQDLTYDNTKNKGGNGSILLNKVYRHNIYYNSAYKDKKGKWKYTIEKILCFTWDK